MLRAALLTQLIALTMQSDVVDFNAWLGELPHRHKVVVEGNHESNAEWAGRASAYLTNATFLRQCSTTVSELVGRRIASEKCLFYSTAAHHREHCGIFSHWSDFIGDAAKAGTHATLQA